MRPLTPRAATLRFAEAAMCQLSVLARSFRVINLNIFIPYSGHAGRATSRTGARDVLPRNAADNVRHIDELLEDSGKGTYLGHVFCKSVPWPVTVFLKTSFLTN